MAEQQHQRSHQEECEVELTWKVYLSVVSLSKLTFFIRETTPALLMSNMSLVYRK